MKIFINMKMLYFVGLMLIHCRVVLIHFIISVFHHLTVLEVCPLIIFLFCYVEQNHYLYYYFCMGDVILVIISYQ